MSSADLFASGFVMVLYLAILAAVIVGMWKVFEKADHPGWASLIPFYNQYVLIKIAGRPGWWFLLYLVPIVNFIISLIVLNDISRKFGKGIGYTLGLIFLPIVFFPLLGFGDAEYHPDA